MQEISTYPLVSIITPAYNAMPYLEKTIKSVLNQHYPNLEHIVMDGGSKDSSVETMKFYNHLTWFSEEDRGQSHALNKGFTLAKGEIIGWLNADDTYEPNAIRDAVNFFEQNPEYDLVGTDMFIIDENDQVIGRTPSGDLDPLELLSVNPIKQPTVFMRRRVIDQLQGVDEKLHYVMDQEFWLRAGMHGFKFKNLDGKVFANFRLMKGTKTFDMGPLFTQEWHALTSKVLEEPFFNKLPQQQKRKILNASHAKVYLAKMLQSVEQKNKPAIIRYFFQTVLESPKIMANRGLWKFLVFGLIGKKVDRLKKFRTNEEDYAKRNT